MPLPMYIAYTQSQSAWHPTCCLKHILRTQSFRARTHNRSASVHTQCIPAASPPFHTRDDAKTATRRPPRSDLHTYPEAFMNLRGLVTHRTLDDERAFTLHIIQRLGKN